MKNVFLDTNIFIRFLVKDNSKMFNETKKLFCLIEKGKIKAETDVIVITEIIWVLSSYFKLSRRKIFEYISLLFKMKNLTIQDSTIIIRALEIYQKLSVDFIDAFCATLTIKKKIKYICSYDKDFDKIFNNFNTAKRIEPDDLI